MCFYAHRSYETELLWSAVPIHTWLLNSWRNTSPRGRSSEVLDGLRSTEANVAIQEWLHGYVHFRDVLADIISLITYVCLHLSPERKHICLLASRPTRIVLAKDRVWMEGDRTHSWCPVARCLARSPLLANSRLQLKGSSRHDCLGISSCAF